jgi:hypothetical protein
VIVCPKCAKIHLQASGGQKHFPGAKPPTAGKAGKEEEREGLAHSMAYIGHFLIRPKNNY